jgi:hypothetical protein
VWFLHTSYNYSSRSPVYGVYMYIHVYISVDSIRKSMLCVWELFNARTTANKKFHVIGLKQILIEVIICEFCGRFNDLVCNCKLSLAHILKDLFHMLWSSIPNFDIGHTVGKTDQQWMLTHPQHIILLLLLSGSIMPYNRLRIFHFGLWFRFFFTLFTFYFI